MPPDNSRRLIQELQQHLTRAEFQQGFDLCERLLDDSPSAETYESLLCPVDRYQTGLGQAGLHRVLAALEADQSQTHLPWRQNLRFALLDRLEWKGEALIASNALTELPERYGWMRANRAAILLSLCAAYAEAKDEYAATLRAAPRYWKAGAMVAECALCLGREEECLTAMSACVAGLRQHGQRYELEMAEVWQSEFLLWMGRYSEALAGLNAAADRGMQLALCWRGAAHMLLGDTDRALADLDRALQTGRLDAEALVWRAETRERRNEWNLAAVDYDRAIAMNGGMVWAIMGRALVKAQSGDQQGFWSAYDMLPARVVGFFEWKLNISVERNSERAIELLRGIRAAARGMRRSETHLLPVFMRR